MTVNEDIHMLRSTLLCFPCDDNDWNAYAAVRACVCATAHAFSPRRTLGCLVVAVHHAWLPASVSGLRAGCFTTLRRSRRQRRVEWVGYTRNCWDCGRRGCSRGRSVCLLPAEARGRPRVRRTGSGTRWAGRRGGRILHAPSVAGRCSMSGASLVWSVRVCRRRTAAHVSCAGVAVSSGMRARRACARCRRCNECRGSCCVLLR